MHQDFGIPQNIFYCVRICLTRLLLFVTRGCCPNCFIPERKLFLKKRIVEKRTKIQETLLEVFCHFSFFCFIVWPYITVEKVALLNESNELRTFYSLCSALYVVNGYLTTYRECKHSVLKIMHALQHEKNQLKITILKHIGLLVMRRIGTIMYGKFALTGHHSYLLSAEVALMFAQHSNVFGSIYLATLWYREGRYKTCIELLSKATKKSTIYKNVTRFVYDKNIGTKCTKKAYDYSCLLEQHYLELATGITK